MFYTVRDEESRQGVVLGAKPSDTSALATSKTNKQGPSKSGREDHCCEHCKKPRHTKDGCFRLHEKDNVLSCIGDS